MIAVDLFSGLGGWTEGLVKSGWYVIRFDIEDMCKAIGEPYLDNSDLVLQDVLTLHGAQFRDVGLIVSSSPCQEFSYRAMPWKRAKALGPPEKGMAMFHAQFRIQREACAAAGRHIPMVVENVRGAQAWVGKAKFNYGSYYLWGDVPPIAKPKRPPRKTPGFRFDGSGRSFQTASVQEGRKVAGDWFGDCANMKASGTISPGRLHGKNSKARKAASAKIAKIPLNLSTAIGLWFMCGLDSRSERIITR